MLSREEKIQHYNDLMQLCTGADEMFKWLDKYRKSGDKRQLFAVKDYESEIRKLLIKIQRDNELLTNTTQNKAA